MQGGAGKNRTLPPEQARLSGSANMDQRLAGWRLDPFWCARDWSGTHPARGSAKNRDRRVSRTTRKRMSSRVWMCVGVLSQMLSLIMVDNARRLPLAEILCRELFEKGRPRQHALLMLAKFRRFGDETKTSGQVQVLGDDGLGGTGLGKAKLQRQVGNFGLSRLSLLDLHAVFG
ncbi:hypothetical protein IWX90DRAFT_173993 [Phyllosticta citrichinensis]|uniref:Uncharacterized protein n=1 Tax=Phyllosticta citrichinensis TaxID=1130410 RepID=A0ABR1XV91_9PEZI